MKKKRFAILSLLVLFFLFCLLSWGSGKKKQKQSQLPMRMKVSVARAEKRTLQRTRLFTGILEPYKKVDLAPIFSGKIKKIHVTIGDYVKKNQVLAVMDDASLVSMRATFKSLASDYRRTTRLYKKKVIAKAQYEKIKAQYWSTRRKLQQIAENTNIRAPFSGIITDVTAEEGELFHMGMSGLKGNSRLIQLTQLDPLKIDLDVDENTVGLIEKDMPVQLSIPVLPDTVFSGKIQWVNPAASQVSNTFKTRLMVTNKDQILKAGYFVEAAIVVDEKKDVLTIPVNALIDKRVYCLEQDSLAIAREVTIGWNTQHYYEVKSGLREKALVIVTGNKALPDSSVVVVENF